MVHTIGQGSPGRHYQHHNELYRPFRSDPKGHRSKPETRQHGQYEAAALQKDPRSTLQHPYDGRAPEKYVCLVLDRNGRTG